MAQKKIQISFPPAVAEQMDLYCKLNGLNRSGMVSMAVASYLNANHIMRLLTELLDVMRDIQKNGASPENVEEMGNIERLLAVLNVRKED